MSVHVEGLVAISAAGLAILLVAAARGAPQGSPPPAGTAPASRPAVTIVPAGGIAPKADLAPAHKVLDLKVGELQEAVWPDGSKTSVKLVSIEAARDDLRDAVRKALVRVEVNGREAVLSSAMYNLPASAGGVQADCSLVRGLLENSRGDPWGLAGDARIRLWPAGAAWIDANTFSYPVRQRWFAGPTQMANEPTYVDGVENPLAKSIYYHYGLDFGGAEGLIDILSATDGLVLSAGNARLEGYENSPVSPRYDTIYVLDRRGWFHRYSHLLSIDPSVKVGGTVKMGQTIGLLGKEGDSGGWSHLHYQINSRQPSGRWGIEEAYAFVWEAYRARNQPRAVAVARPHVLASAGSTVELDGSKSWAAAGKIERFEWTFTDGTTAAGARVSRKYEKVGQSSEILKVTDSAGNVDYDFLIVQIADKERPRDLPPGIHLAYAPTMGLRAGQEITFEVRSFGTTAGQERIDFGDGSPAATAKSDGCVNDLAKDGYAVLKHAFAKAGQYVVTARRTNERSQEGVTRVLVVVEGN
jgi:murein DD-endopeptidase MepM/ murein hydrolase activator NlpD